MPRYTMDFDKAFDKTLGEIADGRTKAEGIRRAVASYSYLRRETKSGKLRVALVDESGVVKKEIVLP
jgi:hypothetical protein